MKAQETLLAGQILQSRDKLFARRHSIPSNLIADWENVMQRANELEPSIDRSKRTKSIQFRGNATALQALLMQINQLAKSLPH